jgi:hypothetical protein
MRRRRSVCPRGIGAVPVLAVILACGAQSVQGADEGGVACTTTQPRTCPTPTPSWKSDVQPIIAVYCNGCHGAGGIVQRKNDFTTYAGVYVDRPTINWDVFNCKMPLVGHAQPSLAEREILLAWTLPCGAPEN